MKKILLSLVNCFRKIEKCFEDCFHKETGKMEELIGPPDDSPFTPDVSLLYFYINPPM